MKASRILALLLAVLLLAGLPAPRAAAETNETVRVSDARGLLEAIAPHTTVELEPGTYRLSETIESLLAGDSAAWLADHPCLRFDDCYDGHALAVCGADGLTLRGLDGVELVVEPRQADVLHFEDCEGLLLENMTLGHTARPGVCMGDVLDFSGCRDVVLRGLDLYGCGAYGVTASACTDLRAEDSTIRDCSYGAMTAESSRGLRFVNCDIHGCGGYNLLVVDRSGLSFDGCRFEDNSGLWGFLSQTEGNSLRFYDCRFGEWETMQIEPLLENPALWFDELCEFAGEIGNGTETVASVEELFEAIRPGAVIFVQPGVYDLSAWIDAVWAEEGERWNDRHPYVRLQECYDGVQAVISGADGLSIMGLGADRGETELTIAPRYANVLGFENCLGVSLANLTLGHTQGGDCSGSVLYFTTCTDLTLTNLDLYGCGTFGVDAFGSGRLSMRGCRVHDCLYGPVELYNCWGDFVFEDCVFTDSDGGFNFIESTMPYFLRCVFGSKEYTSVAYRSDIALERCYW